MGWTLFAQHHTPSEGSLEGDSDTEDGMQANGGGRASHRAAVSGAHGSPWRIGRLAMRYPLTVGLTFANRSHEASFGRWYARHMWKYDAVAMAMCIVFQTVLVFVPGTSYGLFFRLSWTKWAFGYCHVVPLAAILMPRGRTWYQTHRDTALLVLLGAMLIYHHVLLENYRHIGPPAILQCSNVAYSFLWLPFVALLFQMRLRLLGPGIAVATAVNLTLLSDLCQVCPSDPGTMRRCIVRGASKVAAIVAAALFVVYFVEWRARRLWMTLVASSGF